MRPSFIFELLLIFVLIAFAASIATVESDEYDRENPLNKVCTCTNLACNCCRDFSLSIFPLRETGCATLQYLKKNQLVLTMSFGDRVLANSTVDLNRTPKPVCVKFPGEVSEFCVRIYDIGRKNERLRACLGLELRSFSDIEASLKVSCFKFGADGFKLDRRIGGRVSKQNESGSRPNRRAGVQKQKRKANRRRDDTDDADDSFFGFYDDSFGPDHNKPDALDELSVFEAINDDLFGPALFAAAPKKKSKLKRASGKKKTATLASGPTHLKSNELPKVAENVTTSSHRRAPTATTTATPEPPAPTTTVAAATEPITAAPVVDDLLTKIRLANEKYSLDNRIKSGRVGNRMRQTKEMIHYSKDDMKKFGFRLAASGSA